MSLERRRGLLVVPEGCARAWDGWVGFPESEGIESESFQQLRRKGYSLGPLGVWVAMP